MDEIERKVADAAPGTFGPGFSAKVLSAVRQLESSESGRELGFAYQLSAFWRVGLAGAFICLLLAFWLRFLPSEGGKMRMPHSATIEAILGYSMYRALEQQI